jgi:hypothetical protein
MTYFKSTLRMLAISGFAVAFVSQLAVANPILLTIGPDANFIPRQLVGIDVGGGAVQSKFGLGDGSAGFIGGIAYTNSGSVWVISQDSLGISELSVFTLASQTPSPQFSLGTGFTGGLSIDTVNGVFAIRNDEFGASTFYQLNLLGGSTTNLFNLGSGFTGGLTFDSANSTYYAIANDYLGNSVFYSITLGGAVTPQSIVLGSGFTGGLAYDPAGDLFYAINSDSQGNSTLVDFSLGSSSPNAVVALGVGFNNAALTVGPAAPSVPEPAGVWLTLAGLAGIGCRRRFVRN